MKEVRYGYCGQHADNSRYDKELNESECFFLFHFVSKDRIALHFITSLIFLNRYQTKILYFVGTNRTGTERERMRGCRNLGEVGAHTGLEEFETATNRVAVVTVSSSVRVKAGRRFIAHHTALGMPNRL